MSDPLATDEPAAPVHPGVLIRDEFLSDLALTPAELAEAAGLEEERLVAILSAHASIDAEVSLRLGKVFGQSPRFWFNLQNQHDIEVATRAIGADLDRVQPLSTHAAQ
jgi:antitoxin HigA-1